MPSDPRTHGLHETCNQRGPHRPLFTKGGPPNYVEKSLAAAAEPFKGITTNGDVIADLFNLQQTGVSTNLIREAAEAFLASLTAEQRARTLFPVDTDQWRKWSNIHPTLLRHGMALFEMNDRQRDCAFALLRESLSQRGFEETLDLMHLNETVLELTGRLDEYGAIHEYSEIRFRLLSSRQPVSQLSFRGPSAESILSGVEGLRINSAEESRLCRWQTRRDPSPGSGLQHWDRCEFCHSLCIGQETGSTALKPH